MELYTVSIPNVIPLQTVTATSAQGIGFFTVLIGGFCALFGVSDSMYANKLAKAEERARENLAYNAKWIRADGVMDVHFQISGLSVLAYGTAYRLSDVAEIEDDCKNEKHREESTALNQTNCVNSADETTCESCDKVTTENVSNNDKSRDVLTSVNRTVSTKEEIKADIRKAVQCSCGELHYNVYCPVCGKKAVEKSKTISFTSDVPKIDHKKISHVCRCGERFYGATCPNCGRDLKDI